MGRHIAVIGGGAAGLAVVRALLLTAKQPLTLSWYGVDLKSFGPAYATDQPWHRLNVPDHRMGLPADRPGDFAEWLTARALINPVDAFQPRGIYGRYLADIAGALSGLAAAGNHTLSLLSGQATKLTPVSSRWQIASDSGESLADAVVLATGNPGLRQIKLPGIPLLSDHPGRTAEAKLRQLLPTIPGNAPVIILGTGLSMLDHTMSLSAIDTRRPIIALSRSGQLSESHAAGPSVTIDTKPLTSGRLSQRLMRLRRMIKAHGQQWRSVLDALRPETVALWQTLSPVDQARFFSRLWSHWNRFRHRAAPAVITKAAELQASGQLRLMACAADPQVIASLKPGLVINALGPTYDSLRGHVLLYGLTGRMPALPSGLPGLPIDNDGRVEGDWPAPLFAIGCLALGRRLETVAMPELRVQAARLAVIATS